MTDGEYRKLCRLYGIDDRERERWVANDESLYRWWKSSRVSISQFIRENRKEIASAIIGVIH